MCKIVCFTILYELHMCTRTRGGQKRHWILELELQRAVRYHVDVGNQTWVLYNSKECS